MKNIKTILAIMAVIMALGIVAPMTFAYSFIFNATNSSTIVSPPPVTLGLSDFTTIYHLDNSTTGRNDVAPGYEYQYAGENVHFTLVTYSNSIFVAENMIVTVKMNCSQAGIQTVQTTRTSPAQYNSGLYYATFQGDYIIPPNISENCPIFVEMKYDTQTVDDYLSNSKYINVNDLLMNPQIVLTENGALSFQLVYNSYAQALPYPQVITITSPTDREAQGVLGTFTIYKTPLVGQILPTYSISPVNYRYAIGMGAWNNMVLQGQNGKTIPIPFSTTNTPSTFNIYWQLYMDGNLPSQQYVGSGWYLISIL